MQGKSRHSAMGAVGGGKGAVPPPTATYRRRSPRVDRNTLHYLAYSSMSGDALIVRGAREHNLKNIDVELPRNSLVVITGLSGSGKSSLAFDTIYAEGQRRYVESLSAYARQFLGLMDKPDVDAIEGLSPAISIEQKTAGANPRSTVGTITEIYDYLRLLWARTGTPHCPNDGTAVERQSASQITDLVLAWPEGTKIEVLAPLVRGRKGEFRDEFEAMRKQGFVRVRVDGETYDLSDVPKLNRRQNHDIAVVVDRLVVRPADRGRLADSIETALKAAAGVVEIVRQSWSPRSRLFSERYACPKCGLSLPELEPRQFSFNSPYGACAVCSGLGTRREVNADLVLGDQSLSILEGVVLPWGEPSGYLRKVVLPALARTYKFDLDAPWRDLSPSVQKILLKGAPGKTITYQYDSERWHGSYESGWKGVLDHVEKRYRETASDAVREQLEQYMVEQPCPACGGRRLKPESLSVLVVEHDEETIRAADYVVDLGPRAGRHGGEVVAAGLLPDVLRHRDSLTARYLRGELRIPIPPRRRIAAADRALRVVGATHHNLKGLTVEFPLGLFIAVTGVSGSGKSTLVSDILYQSLARHFYRAKVVPGAHDRLEGLDHVDKVIDIDQSPIGRTPRSNPATYTGLFTPIRELFTYLPESKLRGYGPGRFSFNVKGGRCEACQGDGLVKVEMHFLPDVYVPCEVCKGRRYNRETLEVRYKGKSIADVLDLTVADALDFFEHQPRIRTKLELLNDVGLGYIHLGQSATTLSGGEAQRVKLATELAKRDTGRTLYILDEPTTGLHFEDVRLLLEVLHRLVDKGNTVVVIEHNLDVVKTADWVVDLGPEGGAAGGAVVAQGSPEQVARARGSFTGQFLRKVLAAED